MPPIISEISDALFVQYVPLLRTVAWKYARQYQVDADDLYGEAQLIFCRAVRTYDPARGVPFTNYLYGQLKTLTNQALRDHNYHIRNQTSVQDSSDAEDFTMDSVDLLGSFDPRLVRLEVAEYTQRLSQDAQQIIDWDTYGELQPPSTAKAKVCTTLTAWSIYQRKAGKPTKLNPNKVGWTWERTQHAWNELVVVAKAMRNSANLQPSTPA
jgi:hypothetical protein